ncbi:basic amino acid ABC transporter substrate-binding protein [Bacillus sp. C11]|nr:basic amino acid ABC transporter substrate-binding protein [Neobacillus terrae]NHM31571.1 basic amino acid ABC transporter substrate-binding protein [Neobacillus terrae]
MLLAGVILAGCGKSSTNQTGGKDTAAAGKKTLRVVTDAAYAPFEYMKGDKIVGFDVDFIQAVVKEAGYKAEVVHVGWDPLFVELENKRADLGISSITINDERKQTYDFSHPYFLSTNKILVPKNSPVTSAEDLKNKVVAVQNGTTGQEAVEKMFGKNNKNLKKFENNNLAIMELNSGGAAAVVADNAVVEVYAKNNPEKKLKVIEDSKNFAIEFYGLAFPKGSKLRPELDKAVEKVLKNGTYEKIYKKWFGRMPDINKLKEQQ